MASCSNSNGAAVHDSTFIEVGRDYNDHSLHIQSLAKPIDGMRTLYMKTAAGAMYNSRERFDAPRCHPETRTAVQNDIMSWIRTGISAGDTSKVLWLTGPAGAGKSAIKQNIAERCNDEGILAASFFFSYRSLERNNKDRLIPTIAYQLGQRIPVLRDLISSAVEKDESIFEQDLKSQMATLILQPVKEALRKDPEAWKAWPKATVIDGLDECQGEDNQLDILETFDKALSQELPFRVTFASRPERAIQDFFDHFDEFSVHKLSLAHDYDSDTDIRTYLLSKFNDIRRKYHINDNTWPGEAVISTLVDQASGQFVFASTVLRFIDDPVALPVSHLGIILAATVTSDKKNPFKPLDLLYTAILDRCPDPPESALALASIDNLSLINTINIPGDRLINCDDCNRFLGWTPTESIRLLGNLRSLLDIPTPNATGTEAIEKYTLYHKSIIDFLRNPIRAEHLYISRNLLYGNLTVRYLRLGLEKEHPWSPESLLKILQNIPLLENFLHNSHPLHPRFQDEIVNPIHVRNWIQLHKILHPAWNGFTEMKDSIYQEVHAQESGCTRYACSTFCKVWRTTIVAEYRRLGWRLPSRLDLLSLRLKAPRETHSNNTMTYIALSQAALSRTKKT